MGKRTVLFLCTGNCCRSPLAEAILRHVAGDRFEVLSAGSAPTGFIHPLTLATLAAMGISADGLESKSWREYTGRHVDLVITVCDQAAQETCPVYPGSGLKVHWPLPDPSFYPGDAGDKLRLCRLIAERLMFKAERLSRLDFESGPGRLQPDLDALADL